METVKYPIVVIGAGAGGLVIAIGAARAGKKVLLIEKGLYGGDCTNFGCIPSKSLIASAEKAFSIQNAKNFGIDLAPKQFAATKALERVKSIREQVRSHEDPEALTKMGIDTITGTASFITPHTLEVKMQNGMVKHISAKKIVIAAGSHPFIPPIEGMDHLPYLTNETVFNLDEIPKRLGILGAGPIGCELAQAFHRLGSDVTIIESRKGIMTIEDPKAQQVIRNTFEREGITLHTRCDINTISYQDNLFHICAIENGNPIDIQVNQLLISTGRRPNIEGLNLEKASVEYSDKGIDIDKYGRTNQSHIFAIGDITGPPFFTHRAENHARAVLTSLLLPGPFLKKLDLKQAIPRCIFTDPEVASIGLQEKAAIEKHGSKNIVVYQISFEDLDRAITNSRSEGFIKIVTKKWSSKILGATIVGPRAGEMLPEISLAMMENIPLRKLARLIHPYPIYNAAIRRCADLWLTQTIFGIVD